MKRTLIIITCDFEALHSWSECPFKDVFFLKALHRHKFFVRLEKEVFKDRGIEFIMFQREVKKFISDRFNGKNLGSLSCEKIADIFLEEFGADSVEVFEDNENGSKVQVMGK